MAARAEVGGGARTKRVDFVPERPRPLGRSRAPGLPGWDRLRPRGREVPRLAGVRPEVVERDALGDAPAGVERVRPVCHDELLVAVEPGRGLLPRVSDRREVRAEDLEVDMTRRFFRAEAAGPPRLEASGLVCAPHPEEPGTLVVERVVPGSCAARWNEAQDFHTTHVWS